MVVSLLNHITCSSYDFIHYSPVVKSRYLHLSEKKTISYIYIYIICTIDQMSMEFFS